MTRVVHVRKEPFDIYIGRAYAEFPESKWNNPFHVGFGGDRHTVIHKYWIHLQENPELLSAIAELRDKTLGCWCKPRDCHGDVLVALADNQSLPDFIQDWEGFQQKYLQGLA